MRSFAIFCHTTKLLLHCASFPPIFRRVCPISRWRCEDGVSVILRGLHSSYRQITPTRLAQPFIFRRPTNCLPQINRGSRPRFCLALDPCHTTKARCVLYYCKVTLIDEPDCGRLVCRFGRLCDYENRPFPRRRGSRGSKSLNHTGTLDPPPHGLY